jgi:cob(I)alamin adenosyltransferase
VAIFVYTGRGWGKTTAALGVALRAVGHGKRVVVVQFMKWRKDTGEMLVQGRIGPGFEIHQFGRPGWISLRDLDERDRRMAERGLRFAERVLEEGKVDVLVLDEINLAVHCGLLRVEEVERLLEKVPKGVHVLLTGRLAPRRLIELADFVVRMEPVKRPKRIKPIEGVNY